MVPKSKIDEILDGYDASDITIATLCSHSSLRSSTEPGRWDSRPWV